VDKYDELTLPGIHFNYFICLRDLETEIRTMEAGYKKDMLEIIARNMKNAESSFTRLLKK